MYEIKDKICLVTGGAAGIGAGVVESFIKEGAHHVAVLDVDVKSGEELEKQLNLKYGPNKVKFHKCDVTTGDLDVAYDKVLNEFKYIDVVVNNAGIMNDSPNVFMKEIEINVSALIKSSLKSYDLMRKDRGGKGGTIINISSIAALFPAQALCVYSATKIAVLQFSNLLGMEPHYTRSGVRVLTICFGCTDTSLFSSSKLATIDKETDNYFTEAIVEFPFQKPESAVSGLLEVYKRGNSASTWLVTSDRPAEDITNNITKAREIMTQGVF